MSRTASRTQQKPGKAARVLSAVRDNGPAAVVAGIAFTGSFGHIVRLCNKHGQHGWVAYATAACVDLLCVAGAEERQRDKRIGRARKRGVTTWPAAVLTAGIVLTLAANLATAGPGAWGKIVAAIPAGTLLLAVSIMERRASFTGAADAGREPPRGQRRAAPGTAAAVVVPGRLELEPGRTVLEPGPEPVGAAVLEPRTGAPERTAGQLLAEARACNTEHMGERGRPIPAAELGLRLRVSKARACELLREIKNGGADSEAAAPAEAGAQ